MDTFPKLLLENARRLGDHPAIREKEYGIWQTWSWQEVADEVRSLACGLAARGFKRGDKLGIIGGNRPRLYWGMAAAQCIGGIPVPTYQDAVANEIQYVLDHAEIRFILVEDQEQVDKILEVKDRLPALSEIYYDDERGMRNYADIQATDFASLQEEGREYDKQHPGFFEEQVAQGKGSDVAIFLYTSGTTGTPKGVVLTHDNVLITASNGIKFDNLTRGEEVLAYLPMAWVGDHIFSYAQSYVSGFCVSCPESGATVMEDLREIGPTYFFAPPPIFENVLTTVMIRMEDAARLKRSVFKYFMDVARRAGPAILSGEKVSAGDRLLYALGELLIYGPLKNTLGMSRIRLAYTAGEAIGPDIFDFYRSLGINIKQLYGQTEASVNITLQPDGEVYPDTVGKPAPDVEIRITDGGEVMYRSPGVFACYFKNEESTRETKTEDGWVHTGDAGFFDDRGHLKIIDRAKDVGKFNDGSLFAPKYIENKLKFYPYIKEAVAFGDQRDYCATFINIDMEAVGNWAERNDVSYASYQDLASRPEVYDLIEEGVRNVNSELAADPNMAASQIRRFLILHKALEADDGELTRTAKVRRRFVGEKYGILVDALFGGNKNCYIETEVTFEDGRKGSISGDLSIRDVETEVSEYKKAS